ncbi:MAG: FxLYD domain-containing protein [Thermoproteota archaeon]|nr:FxLYD domain-containing protein [Thermoproteota archaeon]
MNNYSFPVDSIQILVTTFDEEGKVIETKRVNPQDTYLRPGQQSGFSVSLDNFMSKNSTYAMTSIFKKSSIDKPALLKLNVTTISMNPVYIRGTVTNLGNQSTDDVEVSGIFYDANHTVIDVAKGNAYVNNSTALLPNEKAAFIVQPDVNFRERDKISSYTASVQSPEYAMAPP